MPEVGSTVDIKFRNSKCVDLYPRSSLIFVEGAGFFRVESRDSGNYKMTITNLGSVGNAAPGTRIVWSKLVVISGAPGPAGVQGPPGEQGPKGDTGALKFGIDNNITKIAQASTYLTNIPKSTDGKYRYQDLAITGFDKVCFIVPYIAQMTTSAYEASCTPYVISNTNTTIRIGANSVNTTQAIINWLIFGN